MPHINWKSVSYIINYYLTQWTDNRMPDKRGTDNRGSTVMCFGQVKMLLIGTLRARVGPLFLLDYFDR